MTDKKAGIFNSGRELFYTKGFKDTNVSDITKLAGVGVGTFYNYYASKEKLFMEIFTKENEEFKKSILESIDLNDDPIALVTKLVKQNMSTMNSNLILKEWYNRELFGSLDELKHGCILELLRHWKAGGKIRNDIEDEMILAFFATILNLDIHKCEVGIQYFPQILYHLTEFIMIGLADTHT